MLSISDRARVTVFASMLVLFAGLWFFLARHLPMRYFAWFCLLTGAFAAIELTLVKAFAGRIEKNRSFTTILDLLLGVVFVVAFYLFAEHVYPGAR